MNDLFDTCAILLTNNNTDTKWWHLAARHAGAVCFTAGRINFYKDSGEKARPTNGQTFFYFGDGLEAFRHAFSEFGLIQPSGWEPVENDPQKFGDAA